MTVSGAANMTTELTTLGYDIDISEIFSMSVRIKIEIGLGVKSILFKNHVNNTSLKVLLNGTPTVETITHIGNLVDQYDMILLQGTRTSVCLKQSNNTSFESRRDNNKWNRILLKMPQICTDEEAIGLLKRDPKLQEDIDAINSNIEQILREEGITGN